MSGHVRTRVAPSKRLPRYGVPGDSHFYAILTETRPLGEAAPQPENTPLAPLDPCVVLCACRLPAVCALFAGCVGARSRRGSASHPVPARHPVGVEAVFHPQNMLLHDPFHKVSRKQISS